MTELVAALRARLDDAERKVLAYVQHREPGGCQADDDWDTCPEHIRTAEATPFRDPQFGLRWIAASRAILDEHERAQEAGAGAFPTEYEAGRVDWLESVIGHLTSVFDEPPPQRGKGWPLRRRRGERTHPPAGPSPDSPPPGPM